MGQVRRRRFLVAAGALLVAPLAAEAQPRRKPPRVGFLCARPGPSSHTQAFEQGLRERGYTVGTHVVVDYRFMPPDAADPFPGFVADLVRRKVNVILIGTPLAIEPAVRATKTIPLVMAQSDDPVAAGFVSNLARPGGNLTGFSSMATDLAAKQLELLKQILPNLSRVAVLWNGASRVAQPQLRALENAAHGFGVSLESLPVRSDRNDLARAVTAVGRAGARALVVHADMMFFEHLTALVNLAASHRLPAIYGEREFVDAGGLMSYGTNYDDLFRRAAGHVDKILKGAKPSDLPVEQPTKFELVINLKTAKVLGVTIPQSLLLRADQVIE